MLAKLRAWLSSGAAPKRAALAGGVLTLMITATVVHGPTPPLAWPDASTTGVPSGTSLTAYSGPNPVTVAGTTITGKTITGDLSIQAANVTIRNSLINGSVHLDRADNPGVSLLIEDTEIDGGTAPETATTGICCTDWVANRVELRGGNRGAWCYNTCTLQDSWIHGQAHSTTLHESGIRIEQNANVIHNRLVCDAPEQAPDGGCSAPLTGYPDFQIVHHNLIDRNFFEMTPGGWCMYGGDSPGKPYSGQTHHITVTNNVFEPHPGTSDCGIFGNSDSFPVSDPNSVWSNNTLSTTGQTIPPNW